MKLDTVQDRSRSFTVSLQNVITYIFNKNSGVDSSGFSSFKQTLLGCKIT